MIIQTQFDLQQSIRVVMDGEFVDATIIEIAIVVHRKNPSISYVLCDKERNRLKPPVGVNKKYFSERLLTLMQEHGLGYKEHWMVGNEKIEL
jgi:hypothetical protein